MRIKKIWMVERLEKIYPDALEGGIAFFDELLKHSKLRKSCRKDNINIVYMYGNKISDRKIKRNV